MKILGIETSCDETGIAIIKTLNNKRPDFEILSNIVASQVKLHQKYGGVYPALAKREHEKNLAPVLKKALKLARQLEVGPQAQTTRRGPTSTLEQIFKRHQTLLKETKKFFRKYQKPDIDIIAITVGPGLEPCLWTGINFAKALSFYWNLPIIAVNHIEAHILVNFLNQKLKTTNYKLKTNLFPAIALVVSGGHTQLILMRDFGKYKVIGETRDDAAGECYDKTARILGLSYPGGPVIAEQAEKYRGGATSFRGRSSVNLPKPMIYSENYDFSFSGLKTAVLYDFKKRSKKVQKSEKYIQQMSYEIQKAINDVLIKKTIKAGKDFRVKTIILGGGVSANKQLRKLLAKRIQKEMPNTKYLIPETKYSVDNAAMIAIAGFFNQSKKTKNWKKIGAQANLRIS
ncbi:MAG: tRNA (adenosine(37)-N6)-threonylcarbamoyltransferase complex transferase subunit TsaD [Candidatus Pacebacteria bacterium]|nr:tRNA (adenosine(37)-N6)-threonylcarbamoyltransferase complex transferase subunit TsaD [Candidatus Paceibacterota bacterium]